MRILLFTILLFFVLIGVFFVFFFIPKKSPSILTPTVLPPTKVPNPVTHITLPVKNSIPAVSKNDIVKQLPVVTPEFNIEYFTTTDTFIVTVKESPYEGNKQKATDWFSQRGVSDASKLRLIYTKYRWVQ